MRGRRQPVGANLVRPVLLGNFNAAAAEATVTVTAPDQVVSQNFLPQLGQVFNFTGTMRRGGHVVLVRTESTPYAGAQAENVLAVASADNATTTVTFVAPQADDVIATANDATVLFGGFAQAIEATVAVSADDAQFQVIPNPPNARFVFNGAAICAAYARMQPVVDPAYAASPYPADVFAVTPLAGVVTAAAFDAGVSTPAHPVDADVVVDAGDATTIVGATPIVADATATSFDATVSQPAPLTQVFPDGPTITVDAFDANSPLTVNPPVADVTAAANDATCTNSGITNAAPIVADVTAAANDATVSVSATVSSADTTGVAEDPDVFPGAPGLTADVTGQAFDATVSAISFGDAFASDALGQAVGEDAAPAVSPNAAVASATATGFDATIATFATVAANAGLAVSQADAFDTGISGTVAPNQADVTVDAGDAAPLQAQVAAASLADGQGGAFDATITIGAASDFAFVAVDADDIGAAVDAAAIAALVQFIARDGEGFRRRHGKSVSAVIQAMPTASSVASKPGSSRSGVS